MLHALTNYETLFSLLLEDVTNNSKISFPIVTKDVWRLAPFLNMPHFFLYFPPWSFFSTFFSPLLIDSFDVIGIFPIFSPASSRRSQVPGVLDGILNGMGRINLTLPSSYYNFRLSLEKIGKIPWFSCFSCVQNNAVKVHFHLQGKHAVEAILEQDRAARSKSIC